MAISVITCETFSTGSCSGSAFSLGPSLLSGVVFFLRLLTSYMELFILTSACSGRQSLRSVSRGDFVVSLCSHGHQTAYIGLSRLWVPLPGTVSHLNCARYHGICPVPSKNSQRLLFSPRSIGWDNLRVVSNMALYKIPR